MVAWKGDEAMKDLGRLLELQRLEEKKRDMEEDAGLYKEEDLLERYIGSYKKLANTMKDIAEEYKHSDVQIKEWKMVFEQVDKQIKEGEAHLYEGTENKSKTLYALQEEVQTLADKKDELGQRIHQLENQRKIDQVNLKRLNRKASEIKGQIQEKKTNLALLKKATTDSMKELSKDMDTLRKSIDTKSLEEYDRHKGKQTPVIVRFEDGTCKGCNMQFSLIIGQHIRHSSEEEVIVCENCGRILYVQSE